MSFTSPSPGTPAADALPPEHQSPGYQSVNILCGIALFGLLLTSIWEFGGFTNNDQTFLRTTTHGGNYKLMAVISLLLEGKMNGLLALVFGASLILLVQRKNHPLPISTADVYTRRMLWLMAFGLINAFILVWPGDLLFQFGVMGLLLFGFTRVSARGLLIAALVCTLIYCGKQYWNYSDDRKAYKKYAAVVEVEKKFKTDSLARAKKDSAFKSTITDTVASRDALLKLKLDDSLARKKDTLTKEQQDDKGAWEGMVRQFKYDSSGNKGGNKMMRSGWNKVAYRLMPRTQQKESSWLYKTGIWDIGSMMFLGMALISWGFFNNRLITSRYLLIAIIAILIGWGLGWYRVHFNSVRTIDYAGYIQHRALPYNEFFPIERILLVVGYSAAISWLLKMNWRLFSWITKGLGAVGQLGLTNYIMQTLICTFFFYGYGFGYFGRMQQWELYFFVVEVALVQTVFSVLWLRYYNMGPLEWLLKSLVYRKRFPNKKHIPETVS